MMDFLETSNNMIDVHFEEDTDQIKNHSKNIIDLIEVGDYVNGKKVYFDKIENRLFVGNDYDNEQFIDKMKINSVVTAEQYKSVEYVF